ncbi:MAG: hypothetical protein IIZ99_00260 [Turicibacter sp.]|nr:hypothetical protein [Turicibacter sp.]
MKFSPDGRRLYWQSSWEITT